jgi:hypothetical protein
MENDHRRESGGPEANHAVRPEGDDTAPLVRLVGADYDAFQVGGRYDRFIALLIMVIAFGVLVLLIAGIVEAML